MKIDLDLNHLGLSQLYSITFLREQFMTKVLVKHRHIKESLFERHENNSLT